MRTKKTYEADVTFSDLNTDIYIKSYSRLYEGYNLNSARLQASADATKYAVDAYLVPRMTFRYGITEKQAKLMFVDGLINPNNFVRVKIEVWEVCQNKVQIDWSMLYKPKP